MGYQLFQQSNYAEDTVTRRSVSRFILYVLGIPVPWWLKAQRRMTLSSAEDEWVALSEAVKEVMFMIQLL